MKILGNTSLWIGPGAGAGEGSGAGAEAGAGAGAGAGVGAGIGAGADWLVGFQSPHCGETLSGQHQAGTNMGRKETCAEMCGGS